MPTYEEMKSCCQKCEHYSNVSSWKWPCYACSSSIGNLVEPVKNYFSQKPRAKKYKVYFYGCEPDGTIIEPVKSMIIFAKTESEAEIKFKYAYKNKARIFGWCEEEN